jgi:hypothetical protein
MTKKQLLTTILLVMAISMTGYSNYAYGAISTPTSFGTITVNSNDSLDLICNDPTFDAGESIEGREILIDDNAGFGSPEFTIGGETDLITLTCDGLTINAIDFSSASYTDLANINIRLVVYDDAQIDSQADSTFEVADNSIPIVKKGGGGSDDGKTRPTFNTKHDSNVDVVDCGFSHNGVCYEVTGFHTSFDKVKIPLNFPQTFTISADAGNLMKWMEICLVPAIGEMNKAEWCTEVHFETNGDLKEFKIVSDEILTNEDLRVTTKKEGTIFTASISNVKFVDIPYFEVIGIIAVDRDNRSESAFMNDGFEFTGVPSIDNPIVSVHLPIEGTGLTELQRVDKINNIWETENGIQYTNYELSGWKRITPMNFERHSDSGEIKNRSHSAFQSLIKSTQKNAVDVFDSSSIQGSDKGFKTVEYPSIDSRTQFLLDHDLLSLIRGS